LTSPIIAPAHGKRIEVRNSGVHGKGVFALVPIAKGEIIIEYLGEVISWKKAQKRHPHDPSDPNHTFYFHVSKKNVIDALYGGNDARWINHACAPNCEADEEGGRIFISTLRKIKAGAAAVPGFVAAPCCRPKTEAPVALTRPHAHASRSP